MSNTLKSKKGFTLVEILVVVGLIAILATITIVAINPGKNYRDTRNLKRRAHLSEILSATTQFISEEGNSVAGLGSIPACTGTPAAIGTGAGNVNLAAVLVDEYIPEIPTDPQGGTQEDTGYEICLTSPGERVQLRAPSAEGETIVVK